MPTGRAWRERSAGGYTLAVAATPHGFEVVAACRATGRRWRAALAPQDVARITSDGGRVLSAAALADALVHASTCIEVCGYTELLRKELGDDAAAAAAAAAPHDDTYATDPGCPEAYRHKRYILATCMPAGAAARTLYTIICTSAPRVEDVPQPQSRQSAASTGDGRPRHLPYPTAQPADATGEVAGSMRSVPAASEGAPLSADVSRELTSLREQNTELKRVNKTLYRRAREDQALLDEAGVREERLKGTIAALKRELADVHRQLVAAEERERQQQRRHHTPTRRAGSAVGGGFGAPRRPSPASASARRGTTSLHRRSPSPGGMSADSRASSRRSSGSRRGATPLQSPRTAPRGGGGATRGRNAASAHISRLRSASPGELSAGSGGSYRSGRSASASSVRSQRTRTRTSAAPLHHSTRGGYTAPRHGVSTASPRGAYRPDPSSTRSRSRSHSRDLEGTHHHHHSRVAPQRPRRSASIDSRGSAGSTGGGRYHRPPPAQRGGSASGSGGIGASSDGYPQAHHRHHPRPVSSRLGTQLLQKHKRYPHQGVGAVASDTDTTQASLAYGRSRR